jgi:anti-anti-sigma factor
VSTGVPSLITFETQENVAVVTLLPGLSNAPWADVEHAGTGILEQLAGQAIPRCLIDLSPLQYMGSAVVALITRVWKGTTSRGGQCVVACPNDVPLEVISIAGLDRLWTVVTSREDGLNRLGIGAATGAATSRRVLAILAAAGAVVALVAALLLWMYSVPHTPAVALLFASSACGFGGGLASLAIDPARTRWVGLAAVIVSAAAAISGAWLLGGKIP